MALYYCKKLQPNLDCKLLLSQLLLFDRLFQSFISSRGPVYCKFIFQPWLRKGGVAVVVAGEL